MPNDPLARKGFAVVSVVEGLSLAQEHIAVCA